MDENLLGYLLNALDEDAHRQVEKYLRESPEGRRRLEMLRTALKPLEIDASQPVPSPQLAANTIARVEDYAARRVSPPVIRRPFAFLRRLDVIVAACLLIALAGLAFPYMYRLRQMSLRMHCQENLGAMYVALDSHRAAKGEFPNVDKVAPPPHNVAGMVVPMLVSEGYLTDVTLVACPAGKPVSPLSYEDALKMGIKEFEQNSKYLSPGFGYSLGYRQEGNVRPPHSGHVSAADSVVVLMADSPPASFFANSPNHGGTGQNVLFIDGSYRFVTTRKAGFQGDDIYLNKRKESGAGLDPADSVIRSGFSQP